MRYSINVMIVSALLGVALLAMGLTVFINLHKFNETFRDSVNERFYFAMEEVRDVVEGEIRLGQSLDSLSNAQGALETLKAMDPFVLSAEIFDLQGRTLHSTDNSYLFDFVPDQWEQVWQGSPAAHWVLLEDRTVVLGVGLLDQFNEPTGSLVLIYDQDIQKEALDQVRQELITQALWGAGMLSLALGGCVIFLTRPLKKRLSEIEQDLQQAQGTASGTKAFFEGYHEALGTLDQVDQELKTLDEASLK